MNNTLIFPVKGICLFLCDLTIENSKITKKKQKNKHDQAMHLQRHVGTVRLFSGRTFPFVNRPPTTDVAPQVGHQGPVGLANFLPSLKQSWKWNSSAPRRPFSSL